ncbi:MAG TPA: NADP-dependent oxidoreductase [Solirubrobacterales bacterium]|jgi:NADPH:quinone reductase-like Zn-dependent oxidoreductase|nr:NADP-dependent oxidoreductase [Solirubrobacterales bacterium]
MRAIVQHSFGGPEVLAIKEVAAPEPIPTEVQVRVQAAGVNPVDCKTRAGKGASSSMGQLPITVGWDVCGEVTAVGGGVTRFQVGDEVFGMPWFPRQAGAYAEYVTAPSRHFEHKPHAFSLEEAGALSLAGLTAWQIVVDTIRVQEGDDVLIHGAAGGAGHLTVQVAAARGANVIATARREQTEFLEGLGAGQVLDYREDDFDRRCADLDSIIDFTGRYGERSLAVLRPGGTLVSVPSGVDPKVHELAAARKQRSTGILVEPDPVGLAGLCDLIERGKLEIEVDEIFDLERAAEAHRHAEASHGPGKIVLRVP